MGCPTVLGVGQLGSSAGGWTAELRSRNVSGSWGVRQGDGWPRTPAPNSVGQLGSSAAGWTAELRSRSASDSWGVRQRDERPNSGPETCRTAREFGKGMDGPNSCTQLSRTAREFGKRDERPNSSRESCRTVCGQRWTVGSSAGGKRPKSTRDPAKPVGRLGSSAGGRNGRTPRTEGPATMPGAGPLAVRPRPSRGRGACPAPREGLRTSLPRSRPGPGVGFRGARSDRRT